MTEPREPFTVRCAKCAHEWVVFYTPIPLDQSARMLKSARCPMCFGTKVLAGAEPRPTPDGDALAWLTKNDTGISSLTIWRTLMGQTPERADIPYDPSDFGRCHRLLNVMPAWRARLGEVAARYPKWQPFVDEWERLTALFEEEAPSGQCPKLYARMRELRGKPL